MGASTIENRYYSDISQTLSRTVTVKSTQVKSTQDKSTHGQKYSVQKYPGFRGGIGRTSAPPLPHPLATPLYRTRDSAELRLGQGRRWEKISEGRSDFGGGVEPSKVPSTDPFSDATGGSTKYWEVRGDPLSTERGKGTHQGRSQGGGPGPPPEIQG